MSTTTSTISLSNSNIRDVLVDFLEGRCSLKELQEKLKKHLLLNFNASTGERIIQDLLIPEEVKIQVDVRHLRHMLQEFLGNKISAPALADWAALVYMLPSYEPKGETEEEQWQSGEEAVWNILQKLANPNSVSTLGVSIVQQYLNEIGST